MVISPEFFTPYSTNAVRVPPVQLTIQGENRLVNTDFLSSLNPVNYPQKTINSAKLFVNGTAINSPINLSMFNNMNSSIGNILTGLPPIILALTALMDAALLIAGTNVGAITFPFASPTKALSGMNSLIHVLEFNPIGQIQQHTTNMMTHLPSISVLMNHSVSIAATMGLKMSFSSPCSALGILLDGTLGNALSSLGNLIGLIESAVGSGLAAIGGAIDGFMTALRGALAGISVMINKLIGVITEAMNIIGNLSNALLAEFIIGEEALACISNLFSPQLKNNILGI